MDNNADSLDDFFAKKDKRKKKPKSAKAVGDLLPLRTTPTPPNEPSDGLDQIRDKFSEAKIDSDVDTSQKEKKKTKKKKDKDGSDAHTKNEEDEWNPVQDEIDYSGLRIATKNIAKEAADEAAEALKAEPEYDEDGQIIEKSADDRVWKVAPADTSAVPQETHTPVVTPVVAEISNVTSDGKYVPPSRRGGNASTTTSTGPTPLRRPRKKVAPDMNSVEDFPTLGAAPPTVDYDVSTFERVKGGGVAPQQSQSGDQGRLQTSNMYSALDNGGSSK